MIISSCGKVTKKYEISQPFCLLSINQLSHINYPTILEHDGVITKLHEESLLENLLGEHGEVDAPVAPDVAAVGLYILIFVAFGVPVVAQINGALIEEIGFTHTHPVEFGLAAEEAGRLPCKVGITLDLLRERLVHIEVLTEVQTC